MCEMSESGAKTAIAWINLTFSIRSNAVTRRETIVLNGVNGRAELGQLTAVMGPSGAGLTSLLMCFNGLNNWGLSPESEIRLSLTDKIRSTFIAHNEKEFLIMGLTAKQNMIYASKLKNSSHKSSIDHAMNVSTIMSDLMISDIKDTKTERCSGGEQKRLAIGLELTALHKPNLLLCDEPTTGLDSNIAEAVPIETLITIASKGMGDESVRQLKAKTVAEFSETVDAIDRHTKVKLIAHKNKKFLLKDVWILSMRSLTEIFAYQWRILALNQTIVLLIAIFTTICFDSDVGQQSDCIDFSVQSNQTCIDRLDADNRVFQNTMLLGFTLWTCQAIQAVLVIHESYSSGTYLLTQNVMDFVPCTVSGALSGIIVFYLSNQLDEPKRFWPFVLFYVLAIHLIYSTIALIVTLVSSKHLCYVCGIANAVLSILFNNVFIRINDLPLMFRALSPLTTLRFAMNGQYVAIYGQDRCPKHMTSRVLFDNDIDDDNILIDYTLYMFLQIFFFKLITFLILIYANNPNMMWHLRNQLWLKFVTNEPNVTNVCKRKSFTGETDSVYYECAENELDFRKHIVNYDKPYIEYERQDLFDVNLGAKQQRLSIAWIDMTLKVNETLFSTEKLILKGINGFVEFGSMCALMGPSGAGKTSLLRSLNGMNRDLMTKDSKIYLSRDRRIRTCFIAQDQREHIMNGLTVKQTLVYASKLKNGSNSGVDHEINVLKLMDELDIKDIELADVQKCSFGQQKRIVMAMEMTAKIKPNLICVDEPTSGVDSYSALLMIQCFKRLSQRHNLSIITSIHQPNLEIIMLYDMLYILAKGGLTVYSGRPQSLRTFLTNCHIVLQENQIPIEVLMKICANGVNDRTVTELSNKTNEDMSEYISRLDRELKYYANGIPIETKVFSTQEFQDLDRPDGCLRLITGDVNTSCHTSKNQLYDNNIIQYNIHYNMFIILSYLAIQMISTSLTFTSDYQIFLNEYRNYWYSTESYFVVKSLIDTIPCVITIICLALITDIYERDSLLPVYLFVYFFSALNGQSLGHILGICFGKTATLMSMFIFPIQLILGNFFTPIKRFARPFQLLSHIIITRQCNFSIRNGQMHAKSVPYREDSSKGGSVKAIENLKYA
ncbi:unnamed protein product [Medioppia subpectinata]|uniref:ABC transporter domain-containing protein n=1 Tax=Medioppia subpectinata TaxID=1979941 RepID=A0A7R9KMB0_9ACAR|nr:unnamed protein product [Medioppia subpectinata]CAG2106150.1 unnamed protein product [Medioppia subpectinata]